MKTALFAMTCFMPVILGASLLAGNSFKDTLGFLIGFGICAFWTWVDDVIERSEIK